MANTIQIKRKASAGVPSGLAAGELAVNLSDNKLYVGNAAANGVLHLNDHLPLSGGTLSGVLDFGVTSLNAQVLRLRTNSNSKIGFGITGGYGLRSYAPSDIGANVNIMEWGTIAASDGSTFASKMSLTTSGNLTTTGTLTATGATLNSDGNGELYVSRTSGAVILTQAQAAAGKFGTTTDHDLQFMANNTVYARLKNDGRFGIGVTPSSLLHLYSSAPVLTIQDGGTWGTNATGYIELKDSGSTVSMIGVTGTAGHLDILHKKAGSIRMFTDDTERLTISSAGSVNLTGDLTTGSTANDAPLFQNIVKSGTVIARLTANRAGGDAVVGTNSAHDFLIQRAGNTRLTLSGSSVVINDSGENIDFRVEGDGDQNLIRTDASNDRVGIKTASPSYTFHCVGTGYFSQAVTMSAALTVSGNGSFGGANETSAKLFVRGGHADFWHDDNDLLRVSHDGTRAKLQGFTGGAYDAISLNPDGGAVGVGCDPTKMLEVSSGSHTEFVLNTTSNTSNCGIDFNLSGSRKGIIRYDHNATDSSGEFEFYTGGNTSTARMIINGTGHVSINSTALSSYGHFGVAQPAGTNTDGIAVVNGTNSFRLYVDDAGMRRLNAGDTSVVEFNASSFIVYKPLTVGANGSGHDVRFWADNGKFWEWDESMELTRANDGVKSVWGSGDDLEIYHDGSNSYLQQGSNGGNLNFTNSGGTKFSAIFKHADAVELYFNGSKRIETDANGVKIAGPSSTATYVTLDTSTCGYDAGIVYNECGNSRYALTHTASNDSFGLYKYTSTAGFVLKAYTDGNLQVVNKLGIGTAAPGRELDVNGRVLADTYGFRSDTTLRWYYFDNYSGSNFMGRGGNAYTALYDTGVLSMSWKEGLVGIGTTAPTSKLHVTGDLGNSAFLAYIYNSGTQSEDNGLNVQIASSGSSAMGLRVNTGGDSNAFIVAGDGDTGLGFTPSNFAQKLNVNGGVYINGNLGLGRSSPSARLDILDPTDGGISWSTFLRVGRRSGDSTNELELKSLHDGSDEVDGFAVFLHGGECLAVDNSKRLFLNALPPDTYAESTADDFVLGHTGGHAGMTIRSGTSHAGSIYFADGVNGNQKYRGYIEYNHDNELLTFGTSAIGRLKISSGGVGIGIVPSNTALDVQQTSGNILRCKGDSGNTRFSVGASGACTIEGNTGSYPLHITNADSGDLGLKVEGRTHLTNLGVNVAADASDAFLIKSTGDGTNVLSMKDSAGDAMFNVRQSGNDCLIRAYKDGGTQKVQIHTDGSSWFTGGQVGIGTSAPFTEGLEVAFPSTDTSFNLNDQSDSILVLRNSDSGSINTGRFCAIQMKINSSSAAAEGTIRTQFAGDGDADLIFSTTKGGTGYDRMTLDEDGHLSITGNITVGGSWNGLDWEDLPNISTLSALP